MIGALDENALVFEFDGEEYEGRPGGLVADDEVIGDVTGLTLVSWTGNCPHVMLAFVGDPFYCGVSLDRIKPLTTAAKALYDWARAL